MSLYRVRLSLPIVLIVEADGPNAAYDVAMAHWRDELRNDVWGPEPDGVQAVHYESDASEDELRSIPWRAKAPDVERKDITVRQVLRSGK